MFGHFYDTEMFNLGVIVNQAVNNPDGLKKLNPNAPQPGALPDMESVPAMLRPVKKKAQANGQ